MWKSSCPYKNTEVMLLWLRCKQTGAVCRISSWSSHRKTWKWNNNITTYHSSKKSETAEKHGDKTWGTAMSTHPVRSQTHSKVTQNKTRVCCYALHRCAPLPAPSDCPLAPLFIQNEHERHLPLTSSPQSVNRRSFCYSSICTLAPDKQLLFQINWPGWARVTQLS